MRIAIAIDSLAGGGAEKVMITLAKQFIRLGHEPHFLVMEDNRYYETPEDLPVHQCFAPKDKDFDHFGRLNASVHKLSAKIAEIESKVGKFDLFLSNLDKTNLMMTKTGVSPLYVIVHSSVEEELSRQFKLGPFAYFKKLRAKKALNGQHLITVSNGIANEIKDKGRLHPASMQTIYNPFEFNDITSQYSKIIRKFLRVIILFMSVALLSKNAMMCCLKPSSSRKISFPWCSCATTTRKR